MTEDSSYPPRVDIITPTNRRGEFFGSTIGGVVRQSFSAWRQFVVDNNSPDPDALAEAARQALDASDAAPAVRERVQTVREAKPGLPAARNRGIRQGTAEYVTFLDDDDVWAPSYLEAMVAALDAAPNAVAAYCGGWYLSADGLPLPGGWLAGDATTDEMLRGLVPFPRIVSLLVRRSAGDAIGWFNEDYLMAEDNEFLARLLPQGDFVAVPGQLVGYRRHPSSMMSAAGAGKRTRDASERLLSEQIVAARASGNKTLAEQLTENRRRFRRGSAGGLLRESLRDLRHGHVRAAWDGVTWGLTHDPRGFLLLGR